MTKSATQAKKAIITFSEFAGLCTGRIARVHFQRASLEKSGNEFVMAGPSGKHAIAVDATDIDRLNKHWTVFATSDANAYPLGVA